MPSGGIGRYHYPRDDLTQPWDLVAAVKINDFFHCLT